MDGIEGLNFHNSPAPVWTALPSNVTSVYSNITANDNSRIHNGNNVYFHQYYTAQSHGNGFEDSTPQVTLKRKRSLADIGANPWTREAQESLDDVLKKLGKLSLSVRHRKEGDAAEKIARRVAAVFEAITAHGDEASWDKTAARQLGKLGATVKWEERFDINSVPQRRALGKIAKAKRRSIIVQVGHWDISLTTVMLDSGSDGDLRGPEMFSTLRVEPQQQSSRSALAVFFSEHKNGRFTETIPPTVVAYNKVRNDSRVFLLLQDDDLDGLKLLLARGEASIHDCDESGRSFLHYACFENSPKCCSFLVSLGVDIDRLELKFTKHLIVLPEDLCLGMLESTDLFPDEHTYPPEARTEYLSPLQVSVGQNFDAEACFDVLWNAGADPTVAASPRYNPPPLFNMLNLFPSQYMVSLPLHKYFTEGSPYIDFQEKFEFRHGRGYWLELCLGFAVLEDHSLLELFVDKGVDAAETDDYGFNCLFVFMSRASMPDDAREFKALQCLLKIFEKIYALDVKGNDVFAYVNERRAWPGIYGHTCRQPFGDCGSYKQDLWYCALTRGKLDVKHSVKSCKRLARYTSSYTPKHYLALCYLEDWDLWEKDLFERQIQTLLQEHPMSEDEERIQREMDSLRV